MFLGSPCKRDAEAAQACKFQAGWIRMTDRAANGPRENDMGWSLQRLSLPQTISNERANERANKLANDGWDIPHERCFLLCNDPLQIRVCWSRQRASLCFTRITHPLSRPPMRECCCTLRFPRLVPFPIVVVIYLGEDFFEEARENKRV